MKPREVRRHILAEHTFLRLALDDLDERAFRVLEGRENELHSLRECGLAFHAKFTEHLAFEDRFLAPALLAACDAGIALAKHLAEDHREQRELLDYILSGLRDQSRPAAVVAGELRSLVELILDDMAREEIGIVNGSVLHDPAPRRRARDAGESAIPPVGR